MIVINMYKFHFSISRVCYVHKLAIGLEGDSCSLIPICHLSAYHWFCFRDGVVAGSMVITFSAVYRTDKGKAAVTPVSMLPAFKVYRRLEGKGQQRLLCNCLAVPAM
jgi:hypothetical protein